jgi:phage terminase large subunit
LSSLPDWEFPEKLQFLFEPHRYKVAHGGRGSGKSWSFARALLIQGYQHRLRIGCFREIQKSIKDSVHKLLADQIQALGLGEHYEVLDTVIRGTNGTEIIFAGLAQHTVETIKSYEGLDRAWIEEGQAVSKRSWDVLRPTIRKEGSEIWCTYNPELETDATHQLFVIDPPASAKVVEVNYIDNPWFGGVLEDERAEAERKHPKDYGNIWLGKCKPAVAGAIYYDQIVEAETQKRIRSVPRDPSLPVHRVWDLGFNDAMSIILVQRVVSEIAIVGYVEDTGRTLADYISQFRGDAYAGWNWGKDFLPHDGFARRHQTGKTDDEVLRGLGCKVEQTPNMEVEQGIRQARMVFPRVYFDKVAAARLVECLKRYRRQIGVATQEAGAPLHDQYSHGADAFRYLALVADSLRNEPDKPLPKINRKFIV